MSAEHRPPSLPSGAPRGNPGPEHILGLDGLRAVSVLAVLVYHTREGWLRGGFLGVEVFFAISGFLITQRLFQELEASGRIDLGRFWKRRFRRLLPAQAALIFLLLAGGALFLGERASQFRGDLLPSFLYLENWHQVRSGDFYFAGQGLPVLRHLWSLAVEGQFYLAWPPVLMLLWALSGKRRWVPALLAGLLACASLVLMARIAGAGGEGAQGLAGINRAYLGTDTRLSGLLVGGVLAMLLPRRPAPRAGGAALDGFGLLALAGVLALCARISVQDAALYRGGFLLVDLATCAVLAALVLPGRSLTRGVLGWRPLEWIGQRSYGLYLWHWPVFKLLAPARPGLGWDALRWLMAFLLTEASYRWIEAPFRRKGLWHRVRAAFTQPASAWRRAALAGAAAAFLGTAVGSGYALALRPAYVDEVQASLQANAAAVDRVPEAPRPALPATPAPKAAAPAKAAASADSALPPSDPALPSLEGVSVTAIGDSVMKGAAMALKAAGEDRLGEDLLAVNAEESRSFAAALEVVRAYRKAERLGDVVVIHLGTNNSSIPERQFQRLMEQLADRRLVLFLTARSDKPEICADVNRTLARLAEGFPNTRVLDWNTLADAYPEGFYADLTHLRPSGARFYARCVLDGVARALPPAPAPAPDAVQVAHKASARPPVSR